MNEHVCKDCGANPCNCRLIKQKGSNSASVACYSALTIVLQITDAETIEAYKDADHTIILEDIVHGTLGEMCDIVDVIEEESHNIRIEKQAMKTD